MLNKPFQWTAKQIEAMEGALASSARYILGEGGARSGKTFLICRTIANRALKAPGSRHLIGRLHFNHAKTSIWHQTWPAMMARCYPGLPYNLNKQDWFIELGDGAQVWIGGFDDNERMEKLLGNEYCLDPDSKVLMADLTWKRAYDVTRGDEIVAFPEALEGHMRIVRATVEYNDLLIRPRYCVTTNKGETIVSEGHKFVCYFDDRRTRDASALSWRKVEDLQPGDLLRFATEPWPTDQSYDGGWLAGLFDGEGWVTVGGQCGLAQNPGPVLDRAKAALKARNIRFREHVSSGGCIHLCIASMWQAMRAIGSLRPTRLLPQSAKLWEDKRGFNGRGDPLGSRSRHHIKTDARHVAEILSIEKLGTGPVRAIQTSSKTLVSDGFLSHNCSILANEGSQLKWSHIEILSTRLAQVVDQVIRNRAGEEVFRGPLPQRFYIDLNPPLESHWGFRLFHEKRSPEPPFDPLPDPENYARFSINPEDNRENLDPKFLESMERLPARARRRFFEGLWGSATENALWTRDLIERARVNGHPDLQRVVIGVDPSGTKGPEEDRRTDQVGIVVVGLGTDGQAYLLEDMTQQVRPLIWGRNVVSAFIRHEADVIVGEVNFGGAMVEDTIRAAASEMKARVNFKEVTVSRGKVLRAEPISALYGHIDPANPRNFVPSKVHHVGNFVELEDQLCNFTTAGYMGDRSPDRADALVFALAELFPGMTRKVPKRGDIVVEGVSSWNPLNY